MAARPGEQRRVRQGSRNELAGDQLPPPTTDTQLAVTQGPIVIMTMEQGRGQDPIGGETDRVGCGIESRDLSVDRRRFLEAKGPASCTAPLTMIRNEILCSRSKPGALVLGTAEHFPDGGHQVRYLREPFHQVHDSGVTSADHGFAELLAQGELPR